MAGTAVQAQNAQAQKQLSPAAKAIAFSQATRQNWQVIPSQPLVEGGSVAFTVPKSRLYSRAWLQIKGTFTATHASVTSLTKARFAPFPLLKQLRVGVNNGFNPYQISGKGLYPYNQIGCNAQLDNITTLGSTAAVGGASNTLDMMVDISHVLNDRDPVGLILAQNQETVINLTLDFNTVVSLFTDAGLTISNVALNVQPLLETYSIPAAAQAIPDMSVLKMVSEQNFNIAASGSTMYVKLPVGLTYRKILLNFETAAGAAFTDDQIGNLSLIFNQADTPYVVPASMLRKINTLRYEGALPAGVLALDFSYQGLANLGGARDYIDTERLTEFWISFVPGTTGNVQVVSETLARLAGV